MTHSATLAETLAFLLPNLPPRPGPLLEAGCGEGALAAALMAVGWKLAAIDSSPDAVAAARNRGVAAECVDFINYSAPPFAALLFVRSLHHIHPLLRTIARMRKLLKPAGALLVEDAALEKVDTPTAEWFFARWDPLRAAASLPQHRHDPGPQTAALGRWRALHAHEPPLHPGAALREGILGRFKLESTDTPPYLFHYFADIPSAGVELAARILAEERAAIAAGLIRPVGLRLVARRVD